MSAALTHKCLLFKRPRERELGFEVPENGAGYESVFLETQLTAAPATGQSQIRVMSSEMQCFPCKVPTPQYQGSIYGGDSIILKTKLGICCLPGRPRASRCCGDGSYALVCLAGLNGTFREWGNLPHHSSSGGTCR